MKKIDDHRIIAKELDLYFLDDKNGQGLPILLPNYLVIYEKIKEIIKKKQIELNFQEVITSILTNENLYLKSGHLEHYNDYIFPSINKDNEKLRLRPMTCPQHCLIFQNKRRSYKEIPFRLCENSILFRYESSGGLKGLERLRNFEIPDHHIFVSTEKLKEELKINYLYIFEILSIFKLKINRLSFSTRDFNSNKYHSDNKLWEDSEKLLKEFLEESNLDYVECPGEAAFYGPKIDIEVKVSSEKIITLATIQIDFLIPKKFNLNYIDNNQKIKTPVIIHHSPIGSYQRFIALLCEQNKGKFPFWLAPYQFVIIPLNIKKKEIIEHCYKLFNSLIQYDFRVLILDKKSLNYRIRQVNLKKIPYYTVIGEKEIIKNELKIIDLYYPKNILYLSKEKLIEELIIRNNYKYNNF